MISTLKLFLFLFLSTVFLSGEYAFGFHQHARLQKATFASSALQMAGPATIEREKTVKRTGTGPAVLDRPSVDKVQTPAKDRNQEGGETWEVRIYNDGMNTREHVARSLVQITGMAEMTAYQTMMMAHQNGIASVGLFCFEIAEMYNEGLRKEGIVSDIIPVDEEFQ
jgi:ATP-dependent Clp protease adapter protein ClpS|mmetsp:Transcript_9647/g.19966  ORF Transcript_9647/g.19966 Transcript_9647/m.19966 type:complete len:167 (-) Transcript_9647:452-952(-)